MLSPESNATEGRAAYKGLVIIGLLVAIVGTMPAAGSGLVALPNDDAGGSTGDLFYFELETGNGAILERLRRGPSAIRSGRLGQNIFDAIGRPKEPAAKPGEILLAPIYTGGGTARAALLVEASTGYLAYFDQLGRGGRLGEVVSTLERPFESIAAADANFALLMRRESGGRTSGAYLYHGTTGRTLLLTQFAKLKLEPTVRQQTPLPKLSGPISAMSLQGRGKSTVGYVIADNSSGELLFLDLGDGGRLVPRRANTSLFAVLPEEGRNPSLRRFAAAEIRNSAGVTLHALWIDAVSGEMALLENVGTPDADMRLSKLAVNLYRGFAGDGSGERTFIAVPRHTTAGTTGVYVLDSLTSALVYVDGIDQPAEATVSRVQSGR